MLHSTIALRTAAGNIANRRTPGYRAMVPTELQLPHSLYSPSTLRRTHPKHMPFPSGDGTAAETQVVQDKSSSDETLSGNNVSYAKELMRANEANQKHVQMTNLSNAHIGMLQTVLKKS